MAHHSAQWLLGEKLATAAYHMVRAYQRNAHNRQIPIWRNASRKERARYRVMADAHLRGRDTNYGGPPHGHLVKLVMTMLCAQYAAGGAVTIAPSGSSVARSPEQDRLPLFVSQQYQKKDRSVAVPPSVALQREAPRQTEAPPNSPKVDSKTVTLAARAAWAAVQAYGAEVHEISPTKWGLSLRTERAGYMRYAEDIARAEKEPRRPLSAGQDWPLAEVAINLALKDANEGL